MKKLIYRVMSEVNYGTDEAPDIRRIINTVEQKCADADYDRLYAKAKAEAYNGEVTVEEVDDPDTPDTPDTPTGDDSIWEELDKAYQEGVDSV